MKIMKKLLSGLLALSLLFAVGASTAEQKPIVIKLACQPGA